MTPENTNNKIDDINNRLEKLISKSSKADKYEMIRNGLNIVKAGVIGVGIPLTLIAVANAASLPFVDDLRQIKLANMLGPQLMDAFTAIATTVLAHYSSRQLNKHVETESREIENEYSSMKKETFNMRNEGDYEKQNMVEHLKSKLQDADILSPVQKRDIPIVELIDKSKKRSSFKFS